MGKQPTDPNDPLNDEEERIAVRVLHEWRDTFKKQNADEYRHAYSEMLQGYFGRRPSKGDVAPEDLPSRLENHWAACWRPLKGNRIGLDDLAVRAKGDAAWERAHARLSKARAVYGEFVHRDIAASEVLLRDMADGTEYKMLGITRDRIGIITRWARLFTILIPREDGRWSFSSSALGSNQLTECPIDELVKRTRAVVRSLGKPGKEVNADVGSLLLRHAGIAYGVLNRMTAEEHARRLRPRYLVNPANERLEMHVVHLEAASGATTAEAALDSANDFEPLPLEKVGRTWAWLGTPRVGAGDDAGVALDPLGTVIAEGRDLVIYTDSAKRYERFVQRLAQVLGAPPRVQNLEVVKLWTIPEANARAAPGPGIETVVQHITPEAMTWPFPSPQALSIIEMRGALDRFVPEVGGVPRKRVANEDGRAAVEQWLRARETLGLPPMMVSSCWLDLDPLRAELGLPRIVPVSEAGAAADSASAWAGVGKVASAAWHLLKSQGPKKKA